MNVHSPPPVTTGTPFGVRALAPRPVRQKKEFNYSERTGIYGLDLASRPSAGGAGRGTPES